MKSLVHRRLSSLFAIAAVSITSACSGGTQSPVVPLSPSGSLQSGSTASAPELSPSGTSALASSAVTTKALSPSSAPSAYVGTVLSDGAVAFYQLADSGATLADSGPSQLAGSYGARLSHNGSALLAGGPLSASLPGGAYDPAAFAQVAPNARFETPAISVEAWLSLKSVNATGSIVPIVSYGAQNSSTGLPYELDVLRDDHLIWRVNIGAPPERVREIVGTVALRVGTPHHVVGTYDGSTMRLYVDGVLDVSRAIPGTIAYSRGSNGQAGLALGGELQGTLPNFNGTLADVALYSVALPAATVATHYSRGTTNATPRPTSSPTVPPSPTPSPTATSSVPMVTETSKPAQAFVDSFGANSHFNYTTSPYVTQFNSVMASMAATVHHVRDGVPVPIPPTFAARLQQLCTSGIKHSVTFPLGVTAATVISTIQQYTPQCVDYVEPVNEVDGYGNPQWPTLIRAEQTTIWNAMKSVPAFSNVTVLGPALSSIARYALLGNMEAISDAGNMHDATCDGNPGTHWYRPLTSRLQFMKASWPTKPIWTTETAYGDNLATGSHCNLPDPVIAKYVPRTATERWNLGQPRTYWYQLVDTPADPVFGAEGFIDAAGHAKGQLLAMQGLNQVLADPGGAGATASLTFGMDGATTNVHHTLLQKQDGTYYMLLWLEVPGWDVVSHVILNVAPQTIGLDLPASVRSAQVYTSGSNQAMSQTTVNAVNGRVPLTVTDSISVVSFK